MDVDAYFHRIKYDGSREPSLATLRALHRRHLRTVPFENLDIALGKPIQLDLERLYQKIVVSKRGGYCYELNGLFRDLLIALGFTVVMLSAQVRREDGSFGPELDHMLLKVTLDEPWLADVGFGDSFVDPLRLVPGARNEENDRRFGVTQEDGTWELFKEDKDGRVPLYRFADVPRQLSDFENMNQYQQTSHESGFTRRRICTRATSQGRITLAGMRYIVTSNGLRDERMLRDQSELRQCLRERFGVRFERSADLSKLTD
ncbi:MAG TPA: arylamine N-acetyltransferase [Terriglobales bacterium]